MTLSEKCKKHYAAHLTLNHDDFRTFFLQLGCSSATLLIVFFYIYPSLSPPLHFILLSVNAVVFFPSALRSPREAEERMYPRGLCGVLLSVDQHAPDGLTGSSSTALGGTNGGTGPLVYLKHEFNHPQNTWPFRLLHRHVLDNSLKQRRERLKQKGQMYFILLYLLASAQNESRCLKRFLIYVQPLSRREVMYRSGLLERGTGQ